MGNYFWIDTRIRHSGRRVKHSGSQCKICVKNGLNSRTECKQGPTDNDTQLMIHFTENTSSKRDTYLWTSCGDALLIDRARLTIGDYSKQWGNDQGGAWCLSTDANDASGSWANVVTAGTCFRTLRFNGANRRVGGWGSWHPLRRSLEGVPTDAEVDACEEDPERDCTDLVDQVLTFEAQHPEGFIDLTEIEEQSLNRGSGARRLLTSVYKL